jgi:cell division protein FtsZ
LTDGRGAGSIPDVGMNAAIENLEDINDILSCNTKMVFVTAGMGGGTGTGAAPVIAQAAKDMGILTVGIVTVPFTFEGRKRRNQAESGIEKMRQAVDTLLVINNDKLREMFGNLTLVNAFENADDVLAIAAKGIAEVISVTGQINVDFNDVNTVMKDSGVAIMGSAEADGEDRAVKCVESALNSPLLNDNNIQGATYVLLNITYGSKAVLMDEISDITDYIQEESGDTADVIWGHGFDEDLGEKLCVTIIATGFKSAPHTGLPIKETFKKHDLDDERPTIITKQIDSPIISPVNQDVKSNDDEIESIIEKAQDPVKRYILEDDSSLVTDENDPKIEPVQEESFVKSPSEAIVNDGKVRFLLEEDECDEVDEINISNADSDVEENNYFESKSKTDEKSIEPKEISQSRLDRIKKATQKLRSPLGLNEMENEPAYKRRNIELDDVKQSSDPSISRYTLWESDDENGDKQTGLSDNNSFLHDNVD